jgi:hypothetical protein
MVRAQYQKGRTTTPGRVRILPGRATNRQLAAVFQAILSLFLTAGPQN